MLRLIKTRLELTHEERAISVISGPWGIGKTTAVDVFARSKGRACAVVKVEQGSSKRGASPIAVLQQSLEAIRPHIGRSPRAALSNAYWSLRQMIYNYLAEWKSENRLGDDSDEAPLFTIIFDEAQYLSREAIEMLRFWNDPDRTVTPFALGLAFVGNSEFALEDGASGDSVLSGAVRSRALFIEALEYADLTDGDIVAFLRSRGEYEAEAMSLMVAYFSRARARRDIRAMARMDALFRRRSEGDLITAEIVRDALG